VTPRRACTVARQAIAMAPIRDAMPAASLRSTIATGNACAYGGSEAAKWSATSVARELARSPPRRIKICAAICACRRNQTMRATA